MATVMGYANDHSQCAISSDGHAYWRRRARVMTGHRWDAWRKGVPLASMRVHREQDGFPEIMQAGPHGSLLSRVSRMTFGSWNLVE